MADARATIREVSDKFFFPHMNIYRQSFKNETTMEIWKEVESYYLPGAPPIYSKPMEFFSYLLGKAVVGSQLLNMIEARVDTVSDIGKIDFNQLHEEVHVVMDQIRKKAFEISILERQKEKNDFLILLRTASGLIVFYWNKVLEHTESPSFHAKYLDSKKQWEGLVRDALENGENQWLTETFSKWLAMLGGASFVEKKKGGLNVIFVNSLNWSWNIIVMEMKLLVWTDSISLTVGFGITEINRFLHRVHNITLILEGKNPSKPNRQTLLEKSIRSHFIWLNSDIEDEKTNSKDNEILLPLCVIRNVFLNMWDSFLFFTNALIGFDENQHQQSVIEWNRVRNVVINELLKSKAFTQKQLEDAPNNFLQVSHQILEKLKQHTDLFDGFDEKIDPTVLAFERSLHHTNVMFHEV